MDEVSPWEAVFWDVGGVILSLPSVRRAHAAFVDDLCSRFSCAVPTQTAVDRWRTVVGEYFAEREEMAYRPAREAYDRAVDAVVEPTVPRSAWRPLFRSAFDRHVEANPEAVDTVAELARSPVHVGVVSDVDHDEGRRILDAFDLLDRVDSFTSSEEVGHTKPHPHTFETALAKADVSPGRSLMIGDRYEHDVEGAAAVGLSTVAYGAEEGPAVDYRVESLSEVLDIVASGRPET
ncbi:MAG: HAD family hydrolase [Halanaeroarchaeum sp.]